MSTTKFIVGDKINRKAKKMTKTEGSFAKGGRAGYSVGGKAISKTKVFQQIMKKVPGLSTFCKFTHLSSWLIYDGFCTIPCPVWWIYQCFSACH